MNENKFYNWNSYEDYLGSVHYADISELKLKEIGLNTCQDCHNPDTSKTSVRIMNFDNFPNVEMSQLRILCNKCCETYSDKNIANPLEHNRLRAERRLEMERNRVKNLKIAKGIKIRERFRTLNGKEKKTFNKYARVFSKI